MGNDIEALKTSVQNLKYVIAGGSSSSNISTENKKEERQGESFNPEEFFDNIKPIDKIDVGYVIFTKMRDVNGSTKEYVINIEDYNNENKIKNTEDDKNNEDKENKAKTELGVTLPKNKVYHFSINNEDLIFKRVTVSLESIKDQLERLEKDKKENEKVNNGKIQNAADYEPYKKQLEQFKKDIEENPIEELIKKFVKTNVSIFGETDDYITAYVYDNPEHNNEIAEIKINVSKDDDGNESTESYKFNSLPDQLHDSNFVINPLIVGIFDLWKNSILYETKAKKQNRNAIKFNESVLYEDSNNSEEKQQYNITSTTSINEKINSYNYFVERISSKIKQLYSSYISLDNNKNIDGVFINSEFYKTNIEKSKDFSKLDNVHLIGKITELMQQKNKEPNKEGYLKFDNIFDLKQYKEYEEKLKNDSITPDEVYRKKFNKIYGAIKQLTILEEEYVYDVRETLLRMYNKFKEKKFLEESDITEIKNFLKVIFVVKEDDESNDKLLVDNRNKLLYAAYYAYTLIKIIKNKLINKMDELSDILDDSSDGSESENNSTDERLYRLVENFIELNNSYPSEDDIEKYKNVIKQLKINKNNMNKVENLLKERLSEKGILDAQYAIENVALVYDDSTGKGFFEKISKAISILLGKKYVTTKDFLSNKKIKGSIFEEAIKYSYLTKYYENMFDDDGKEKLEPTHQRVTNEIKDIISSIPKDDRITLDFISKHATIDVGIFFGLNPQNILTSLNENKKFTNEFKQDAWLSKSYFTSDNEIASSVILKGSETVGYIQAYNKFKILKSLLNKIRGR